MDRIATIGEAHSISPYMLEWINFPNVIEIPSTYPVSNERLDTSENAAGEYFW